MTEDALSGLLERFRPVGLALCARLDEEIRKLGFADGAVRRRPVFEQATYSMVKDTYSGEAGLVATWADGRGYRVGNIQFNADGSFYAEFDVAEPHPTDRRWFVEGVAAWGRDRTIKAEPKLLAALE